MRLSAFATGCHLARAFTCLLGVGAIGWGGLELPGFWQQASLDRVATEILQGQTFRARLLADQAQQTEPQEHSSFCNPAVLRDAVAIRLAIYDDAIASKSKTRTDATYIPLYDATRTVLSCEPADSFAWLTLFWLDLTKHGLTPENSAFLRLSYMVGPNEGWIALRRSRLAIALFPRLPADLANDAADEFVKLVDTAALYPETAAIFAHATPAVQGRLAAALKSAKPVQRQIFAETLSELGLQVRIPGVPNTPPRPWE
jgi:hypothetical protein